MSEKPWTPGPWIPAGPSMRNFNGPDHYDSVITEYRPDPGVDDNICELSNWPEARNEQNANSCLIAAAPDLYEALEKAIEYVPDLADVPGINDALAKAREK